MAKDPKHFERDTSLASDVADQFGGEAATAEALQEANALRFSEELIAAQLLPADEGLPEDKKAHPDIDLDRDAVADKAGVDNVVSYGVHGDYVVYAYEAPDGRIHKDVLRIESGKVQEADEDSPQRAAVRAQLEANKAIRDAQREAQQIIADAQAERDRIVAEAAAKAQEEATEKISAASEEQQKKVEEEQKSSSSGSSRSSGRKSSRSRAKSSK